MGHDVDLELVRALAVELDRNGGTVLANEILLYDRKLRKLLGDRKLLRFMLEYPHLFVVHGSHGSVRRVVLADGWKEALVSAPASPQNLETVRPTQTLDPNAKVSVCEKCGCELPSRNALFKHLSKVHGGSSSTEDASTDQTQLESVDARFAKNLEQECVAGLRQLLTRRAPGQRSVQIDWLSTIPRVRAALTHWLRARIDAGASFPRHAPRTSEWWSVAITELLTFLRERPSSFFVMAWERSPGSDAKEDEAGSPAGDGPDAQSCCAGGLPNGPRQPERWRRTHVGITAAAHAASAADDEQTATALADRVEYVLRRLPEVSSGPRHAWALLGAIAQDVGVQRLLRGRLLARVLAGDSRFELGEDPKRGVTVRLVKSGRFGAGARSPEEGDSGIQQHDLLLRPLLMYRRPRSDAIADNSEWSRGTSLFPVRPVVVLSSVPGVAAVLDKSAGETTEQLISRLETERTNGCTCVEKAGYRIRSVSRLDAPTSGALVVPLSDMAEAELKEQFSSRHVSKVYVALVHGAPPADGVINVKLRVVQTVDRYRAVAHPNGKPALTAYRVLCSLGGGTALPACSLVVAYPLTGRMHQIRAHFAHLGHPLAGDVRYAPRKLGAAWSGCRLFLHAAYVAVSAPGAQPAWSLSAASPLPGELREVLRAAGAGEGLPRSLGEAAFLEGAFRQLRAQAHDSTEMRQFAGDPSGPPDSAELPAD